MSIVNNPPKEEHLAYLRKCVISKYGGSINNKGEAERFLQATNLNISPETVLRLFGVKKGMVSPNYLSSFTFYVSGLSWFDFVDKYLAECDQRLRFIPMACLGNSIGFKELKEKIAALEKRAIVFQIFKEVILIKFAQKDEVFFERIFEFTNIFDAENYNYDTYYIIQLLGLLVLKNKWIQTIAVKNYHSLTYKRDYFVEWFVQPEEAYYNQLLENYYKGSNGNKKKEIFYHLIKATSSNGIDQHYEAITNVEPAFWEDHHILAMRWFGVQWLNGKENQEAIFKELKNYLEAKKDHGDYITCILFITQYLFKTKSFDEIIELISKIKADEIVLGHAGYLNWNNLKVYYATCLLKTGDKKSATDIFKTIEPDQFDWNFRKELIKLYEDVKGKF